jgi:ADP-ribose pyrophosphatase YjhB (NUDIX family)
VADDTGDAPRVRLERWDGTWPADDEFAGLKADVAAYGHTDPLATLRTLSDHSGVPVGALVRYVLARWASGGSETLLELGTSGVEQLRRVVDEAERAGTEAARLAAYDVMRQQVTWLAHGLDRPEVAYPEGGGGARRLLRLGVYAVITDERDRLLLTRLAPGRPHEGHWTLPGGGLDHGEQPRDGVVREVHEETGLVAEVGTLIEVDAIHLPPERTPTGLDAHSVRLLFDATVDTSRTPRVVEVGGSTDAVRWVEPGELPALRLVDLARHGARLAGVTET